MNKSPANLTPSRFNVDHLLALVVGAVMGHVVMAMATHQAGSLWALPAAVVFVVSGAVSLLLFLTHRHLMRHSIRVPVPVRSWLLCLGGALLLSMHFGA